MLASRIPPHARERPARHVERAIRPRREHLRAGEHSPQFVAHHHRLSRARSAREPHQFRVILVVAEDPVQRLHTRKARLRRTLRRILIRRIQRDAKRHAHLGLFKDELFQPLVVARDTHAREQHCRREGKKCPS